VAETVPGFETAAFAGIGAPKDTSASTIDKLNAEVNAGLADPLMKARIIELGGTPMPLSPADFAKLVGEETEKWGKTSAWTDAAKHTLARAVDGTPARAAATAHLLEAEGTVDFLQEETPVLACPRCWS
jgi:hypothetical protein